MLIMLLLLLFADYWLVRKQYKTDSTTVTALLSTKLSVFTFTP